MRATLAIFQDAFRRLQAQKILMRATLAIFQDAFRRLRAQKIFWIVLFLSAMVVGSFGAVGLHEKGLTILFWEFESEIINARTTTPEAFYKGTVFAGYGVNVYLAYPAVLLALISTASILPDMVSAGQIPLVLSKPLGRVRIFLTVYVSGLLFVGLQVLVFCVASLLVLGFRGGYWDARVFWAVPLVVCMFSYLYCVCAVLGVATRSTLTALLLTLLLWMCLFILHATDVQLIALAHSKEDQLVRSRARLGRIRRELTQVRNDIRAWTLGEGGTPPPARPPRAPLRSLRSRQAQLERQKQELQKELNELPESIETIRSIHRLVCRVKAPLPKIQETSQLTQRFVLGLPEELSPAYRAYKDARRAAALYGDEEDLRDPTRTQQMFRDAEAAAVEVLSRNPIWVVGSSLAFEAVVLALGAWIFTRRDF